MKNVIYPLFLYSYHSYIPIFLYSYYYQGIYPSN